MQAPLFTGLWALIHKLPFVKHESQRRGLGGAGWPLQLSAQGESVLEFRIERIGKRNLTKMRLKALASMFVLVGFGTNLHAADCSAILKDGIFDLSTTQNEEQFYSTYLDYLNKQSFTTVNQAQTTSMGYGINIPSMGQLNANDNNADNMQSEWANYYNRVRNGTSASGQQFRSYVRNASPDIIDAWKACAVNETGPVLWAEWVGSSDVFYLSGRFVLDPDGGSTTYPTVFQLQHRGATCSNESNFVGHQLNGTKGGSKLICTATHGVPIPILMVLQTQTGLMTKLVDWVEHKSSLPTVSFTLKAQPAPPQATAQAPTAWFDPSTGLTWQFRDSGRGMTFSDAVSYCSGGGQLPHDGRTWQLPSEDQLASLDSRKAAATRDPDANFNTTGPIKLFGSGGERSAQDFTDTRPNQQCDGGDPSRTNDTGRASSQKRYLYYFGDNGSDGTHVSEACDHYNLVSALCVLGK